MMSASIFLMSASIFLSCHEANSSFIWINKLLPRVVLLLSTCSTTPAGLISPGGAFLIDTVMIFIYSVPEVKAQDKSLNGSIVSNVGLYPRRRNEP